MAFILVTLSIKQWIFASVKLKMSSSCFYDDNAIPDFFDGGDLVDAAATVLGELGASMEPN
jgi:hypothetical protein